MLRERAGELAKNGWWRFFGAFLGGLLMALGQAPFSLPIFVFIGFPILCFLLANAGRMRSAALIGVAAGSGYFALSLFWIVDPFMVDVARTGWMAPFALFFMAVGLALFWMAASMVSWRLAGGTAVSLAAGLTVFEFLRAHVLTGFPWAMIGYVWSDTTVMQVSSLVGSHGVTLLTLIAAALLTYARPLPVIGAVAIIAAGWGFGWQRLKTEVSMHEPPRLVRLIQPNAPQDQKWKPEMMRVFYERQLEFTQAGDGPRPDIVIWPEASVPFLLDDRPDLQENITDFAGDGTIVIMGIRRIANGQWRNSLAVLGAGGTVLGQYDKHHLVPFGEYIPFSDFFKRFGISALAGQSLDGFKPGTGPETLEVDPVPAFIPLICYEIIFPGEIARAERPDWLVNVTNDAWFGNYAGPYQHLAQARVRAIEFGLPVARSANTGISAMIDPLGRVTASLPLNEAGYIDAPLTAALAPTLFSRIGEWPSVLAALALFAICVVRRRIA